MKLSLLAGLFVCSILFANVNCASSIFRIIFARAYRDENDGVSVEDVMPPSIGEPTVVVNLSESEDENDVYVRAALEADKKRKQQVLRDRRAQYLAGLPKESDPMQMIQESSIPRWDWPILTRLESILFSNPNDVHDVSDTASGSGSDEYLDSSDVEGTTSEDDRIAKVNVIEGVEEEEEEEEEYDVINTSVANLSSE